MSKPKKSAVDLGGLDNFNVSDLMGSVTPASVTRQDDQTTTGKIVYLPFSILHDDPDNSRTIFDEKEIESLAESIKAISSRTGKRRGIKEPISVRKHPEIEGEYFINSGHRRKRAGLLAGETEAPCFVDEDADDYDNTIVNMKRVGLTVMEVAAFIQRRLEAGDSKGDIAKALGQSASYISDHVIFFDMPDFVRELYDEGICLSMQGLAILHRAAKKNPNEVQTFCVGLEEEIPVSHIRSFVETLKEKTDHNKMGDGLEDLVSVDQDNESHVSQDNEPDVSQEQITSVDQDNEPGISQEPVSITKSVEKELLHDLKLLLAKVRNGDVSQLDEADKLIDLLISEY